MSSSYVNDLRLEEIGTGDQSGTWGTTTNTNLELIGEALGYGTQNCFATDADATTTVADGASDPARSMYFKVTSSATLTATRVLTIAPNTISRVMFIENATTGSQSITISQGSGANVTIATGKTAVVYLDGAGSGAAVVDAMALVDPGVTDTLAEVLVAGNTSGGTGLTMSSGDDLTLTGASYNVVWDSSDSALEFADNAKAVFGAGSDLEIYHDGTDSYISDQGSGTLKIQGDGQVRLESTAGERYFVGNNDGAARLYYDDSEKLATTATGIDVTGTVTADTLDIDSVKILSGQSTTPTNDASSFIYRASGHADYANGDLIIQARSNASRDIYMLTGTTTPVNRLQVNGNGDISFYEDTGTTPKLVWKAADERLGIGNSSPTTALDVTGTVTADGLTVDGNVSVVSALPRIILEENDATDLNTAIRNNVGVFKVQTVNDAANSFTNRMDIDHSTGDISFYDTSASQAFFWDASAASLGIGSSSPSTALTVSGGFDASTAGSKPSITGAGNYGGGIGFIDTNVSGMYTDTSGANLKFFTNQSASDAAQDKVAMTINGSGSVGIGTSSPASELHVKGSTPDLRVENTTASETVSLSLIKTATKGFSINNKEISGTNYLTFNLDTAGAGTDAMVIHPTSGNVGIGVSSPSGKIQANAAASQVAVMAGGTVDDPLYPAFGFDGQIGSNGGRGAGMYLPADGTLAWSTSGSERMRIDSSGNVGIGTTSPAQLLHLRSGTPAIEFDDSGFATVRGRIYSNEGNLLLEADYNDARNSSNIAFNVDGSEAMRIDSSGRLLINTTSGTTPGNNTAFLVVESDAGGSSEGIYIRSDGGAGDLPFVVGDASNVAELNIYGDGDVENTNGTYGTISDARVKENITDAASQWEDFKAIRIRRYNLISKPNEPHIGVIAQELEEAGMGGLVKDTRQDGMKSVKTSILYMKAIKALQEAMERIETLEAKVAQLEGAN